MAAVAASLVLLVGCGGEPSEEAADTTEAPADTAEHPTEPGVAEAPQLYPAGTLDPATVGPDEAVPANQLFEAYFAWNGLEVTVVGYPYFWYGDTLVVEDEIYLVDEPESTDELATVIFDEPPGVVVRKGELVAVHGTFEKSWTGELEISGASFVDVPEVVEEVETSPWVYDGTTPIPISQFNDLCNAWAGKEVTVEGYYHSTTTSTTDYGTTVRIDLAHSDDTYTKYVGCEMAGEISAESNSLLVNNRDGVQIRGVIAGECFDMVELEGCTLVNR